MSKNEPDNDFTTRTWFVGEEGEEEQAPEDTLIPGEHHAASPSDNDSLIAGDFSKRRKSSCSAARAHR